MELLNQFVDLLVYLVDLFLHLDVHLGNLVHAVGPWLYLILFLVIFCETGLVVTPILPGDSLLFAVGALAALPDSPINIALMALLLFVAAVLGDATNYAIGYRVGPKIFQRDAWLLNRKHLDHTRAFYEQHGGKTIILARFIPIVRTFAPFVAGIGRMSYRRFALFNVTGAACWVAPFLFGGYWLGNLPAVKTNFHIIVVLIVLISVMPAVVEFLRSRRMTARAVQTAKDVEAARRGA